MRATYVPPYLPTHLQTQAELRNTHVVCRHGTVTLLGRRDDSEVVEDLWHWFPHCFRTIPIEEKHLSPSLSPFAFFFRQGKNTQHDGKLPVYSHLSFCSLV